MNGRYTLIALCAVMAFTLGCKRKQECKAVAFPMVNVPAYIIDGEQGANYLARNFWNEFFKIADPCNGVKGAVHGVDSISFLRAFGMYAQLVSMTGAQVVESSVANLFANLDSLALSGEKKPLLKIMQLMEHFFYDPNSPVLDEEMYLRALNGILAAKSLTDLDKMQYMYQQNICSLNRQGTQAADFKYRQMLSNGKYKEGTLYGIKGDYTLLFFNNPDCNACGQILQAILDSPLLDLVKGDKLKVLAMYIDENLEAWERNRSKFPKEWIYAHDQQMVLRDNNIYGLRAIPSMYLLDKEKRVILKDAPVEKVISYFVK